jgi:hypothetical protein
MGGSADTLVRKWRPLSRVSSEARANGNGHRPLAVTIPSVIAETPVPDWLRPGLRAWADELPEVDRGDLRNACRHAGTVLVRKTYRTELIAELFARAGGGGATKAD